MSLQRHWLRRVVVAEYQRDRFDTAPTWMARRGVPLWKIAKFLGNSVEEVDRTYAKHCPADLRDSVEVLSEPFEIDEDDTA